MLKAVINARDKLIKAQKDIQTFVDSILECTADIGEQRRLEIRSAIVDVFTSAGQDLLSIRSRIESIVVLDRPVAFCRQVHWPNPAMLESRCQVVLPLDPGMDEGSLKFYIAHELAHVALVHFLVPGPLSQKAGTLHEAEADILAKAWGYPLPKRPDPGEPKEKKQ